jgi:hypothetical protein
MNCPASLKIIRGAQLMAPVAVLAAGEARWCGLGFDFGTAALAANRRIATSRVDGQFLEIARNFL